MPTTDVSLSGKDGRSAQFGADKTCLESILTSLAALKLFTSEKKPNRTLFNTAGTFLLASLVLSCVSGRASSEELLEKFLLLETRF